MGTTINLGGGESDRSGCIRSFAITMMYGDFQKYNRIFSNAVPPFFSPEYIFFPRANRFIELIIIKFPNYGTLINYGNVWKFVEVFPKNESRPKIKISDYRSPSLFFLSNRSISLFAIPLKRIKKRKKIEKYRGRFIFSRGQGGV